MIDHRDDRMKPALRIGLPGEIDAPVVIGWRLGRDAPLAAFPQACDLVGVFSELVGDPGSADRHAPRFREEAIEVCGELGATESQPGLQLDERLDDPRRLAPPMPRWLRQLAPTTRHLVPIRLGRVRGESPPDCPEEPFRQHAQESKHRQKLVRIPGHGATPSATR